MLLHRPMLPFLPRLGRRFVPALLMLTIATGCVSLNYDLSAVPIPISAKPATAEDGPTEPFTIQESNVLWVHGLFGHTQPDVAALVTERTAGARRIVNFRVRQTGNLHQWLATHLSLTLFRMRRVVITGEIVR